MRAFTSVDELREILDTLASHLPDDIAMSIDGDAAMLHYGSGLPAPQLLVNEINDDEQRDQLETAAAATAAQHQLPPGWLKHLARPPQQTYDFANPVYEKGPLTVYIPRPEAMLADRIDAGLPNDATMYETRTLCAHLEIKTLDNIRSTHRSFTGTDLPTPELEDTFEDLAIEMQFPLQKQPPAQTLKDDSLSM